MPAFQVFGQTWLGGDFQSNFAFRTHLLKTGQYQDLLYLNQEVPRLELTKGQQARLAFLSGKAHYELRNFGKAGTYFYQSRDIVDSGLSQKTFLGAYSLAQTQAYKKADELLVTYRPLNHFAEQYCNYFRSGMALLDRNYMRYDSLSPVYKESHSSLDKFHQDLNGYKSELQQVADKKPWKGAVLSGLVPGLGKVYAGRPKSGLSAFLQMGLLGIQAYEGYSQKGFQDPHFYIFGGLFTVFYVGNIWGSANSVKKVKHEQYRKIDQELLKDMDYLNDRFVE